MVHKSSPLCRSRHFSLRSLRSPVRHNSFFSSNFIFLLPALRSCNHPLAKSCNIHSATVERLTCECVCSCAITPITATSATDRSISHALGSEFQKGSRLDCFQQSDESPLFFSPKCLMCTATTPHTWLLSRHRAFTFIIRLSVLLPTLFNWSLVCGTQILQAELAERSGRRDVVLKKGPLSP